MVVGLEKEAEPQDSGFLKTGKYLRGQKSNACFPELFAGYVNLQPWICGYKPWFPAMVPVTINPLTVGN